MDTKKRINVFRKIFAGGCGWFQTTRGYNPMIIKGILAILDVLRVIADGPDHPRGFPLYYQKDT
jgi:hypothetical protein